MTSSSRTQVRIDTDSDQQQFLVVTSPDGSATRHPLIADGDPVGLRAELFGLGYSYSPPKEELKAAALEDFWEAIEASAQNEIDLLSEIEGNRGFYDEDTDLPLCPADITRIEFSADSWDNGWFIYSQGEFSTGDIAGVFDYPEDHEFGKSGLDLRVRAVEDGDMAEHVLVLTDRTEHNERFDRLVVERPEGYRPKCGHAAAIEAALNDPEEESEGLE